MIRPEDANDDRLDPDSDPFKPPTIPTEVHCIHCNNEYQSYLIEWRVEKIEGREMGFWCCPVPGCDGRGFGFDIFPTDPEYVGEDGEPMWCFDDDDEDYDEDEFDAEWDQDTVLMDEADDNWLLDDGADDALDDESSANGESKRHRFIDEDDIPF